MRVALADDSTLFRRGLVSLLESAGVPVIAAAPSGTELLSLLAVESEPPDAVVLDIRMPPTFTDEGIVTAGRLRQRYPAAGVLVLSTYAQVEYAARLLDEVGGGVGYLLKDRVDDVGTLTGALGRVARGESVIDTELIGRLLLRQRRSDAFDGLTDREQAVLRLMAEGRSNAGIAAELHLSAKTVEGHVAAVFTKLDLRADSGDNRRVLAVLSWLRATAADPD